MGNEAAKRYKVYADPAGHYRLVGVFVTMKAAQEAINNESCECILVVI